MEGSVQPHWSILFYGGPAMLRRDLSSVAPKIAPPRRATREGRRGAARAELRESRRSYIIVMVLIANIIMFIINNTIPISFIFIIHSG